MFEIALLPTMHIANGGISSVPDRNSTVSYYFRFHMIATTFVAACHMPTVVFNSRQDTLVLLTSDRKK